MFIPVNVFSNTFSISATSGILHTSFNMELGEGSRILDVDWVLYQKSKSTFLRSCCDGSPVSIDKNMKMIRQSYN